ncbi:MAG: B12-binding domain-containing radical SAM protein [Deltaproteobacteria bacterium]|nr:MAG: B12-binding domain-containing radical SAM protein [Deltaproteobacteria bacterium]
MKIALITPPFDLVRQGYGSKKTINRGYMPPLGIGYIASVLEKEGHQVKIIDSAPLRYSDIDIKQELEKFNPEVIGISTQISDAKKALELGDFLKNHFDVPLIIGGPYATNSFKQILQESKFIDYVVTGEGENSVPELLKIIAISLPSEEIKGIYSRKSRINTGTSLCSEPIHNLDDIPFPARHLYDNSLYSPLPSQSKQFPATSMITSRGCPYAKCNFCYQAGTTAPKYRRHKPERVVEETKELVEKYGIKEIHFWDDLFTVNFQWISKFCELLRKQKINISWTCFGWAAGVSPEMLLMMKESGCYHIKYGFESGNQDLLDALNKGITLDHIHNAVIWGRQAGIEVNGAFMLALPGETPEKCKETVDFAISLDLDVAEFFPFHPYPGTSLYNWAIKKGKVEEYQGAHEPNFVPEGFQDKNQIRKIVKDAYKKFYLRPGYIWKTLKKIKNFQDVKKYSQGFTLFRGISY